MTCAIFISVCYFFRELAFQLKLFCIMQSCMSSTGLNIKEHSFDNDHIMGGLVAQSLSAMSIGYVYRVDYMCRSSRLYTT